MNQTTLPAGKLPGILTTTDRENAEALIKEVQRLTTHRASLGVGPLVDRYRAAAKVYLADPSDKNFVALQAAAFEREFLPQVRKPLQAAEQAMVNFLNGDVREWLTGIVERNLPRARAEFDKVRDREAARHSRLTGGQDLNFSEIVEAARRVVTHLENLEKLVQGKDFQVRPDSILKGLNQFDPDFVPPPATPVVVPAPEVVLSVVSERSPHPMERRETEISRAERSVASAFGGRENIPGAV